MILVYLAYKGTTSARECTYMNGGNAYIPSTARSNDERLLCIVRNAVGVVSVRFLNVIENKDRSRSRRMIIQLSCKPIRNSC
ncbi:MAG: hypothetical protein WAR83_01440 [Flavobacteriales bacterium]